DDYWRAAIGRAGEACFREAGAGPTDMSGLAIYDNFTPSVLFALEGFGYCPPGTAWARIQDGRLRLGGRWPTNTSGATCPRATCRAGYCMSRPFASYADRRPVGR